MTPKEYNILAKECADDIYRFALTVGADKDTAKDAVQEAYASLWGHRDDIGFHKGKNYLLATTYNKIRDVWRHEKVRRESFLKPCEKIEPDESFDLKDAIRKSFSFLTPQQQTLIRLKDIEGCSYKEIEAIMGIDQQRIQVYLFRARVALKRKLNEYGY